MNDQRKAAATAILGLAFGGGAANALANPDGTDANQVDTNSMTFAAVSNLASQQGSASVLRSSDQERPTSSASGTPIVQAATATGSVTTVETGLTIQQACVSGANLGTAFQSDCDAIVAGAVSDPNGTSEALVSLTADQVDALNDALMQQVGAVTGSVSNRLLGLAFAAQSQNAQMNQAIAAGLLYSQTGGAASADALGGQTGFFLNTKYLDGSQDRNDYTYGYNMDGWNLTAGGDYRFGPNLIAGAMINYTQGSTDYKLDKGRMTMDGWGLGAYGTYFLDNGLFFESIAGYNWNDYDLTRKIDYTIVDPTGTITRVNQNANSSPGGSVYYATLGTGYNINRQSFTITPQLSLDYVHNSVDSYREHMSNPDAWGGSWAMSYDSQSYTSFTSRLGAMIAKAVSTGSGVFVPQLSANWIHEFRNNQEDIGARYVSDLSGTPLIISTTNPDRNYLDLSAGVSGQFANGRSAFLNYSTILGYEDVSQYAITGGVRLEF